MGCREGGNGLDIQGRIYFQRLSTLDTRLDLHVAQMAKSDSLAPMEDEKN